jgi:plasmid maintenance system antidote protein VapI
VALIEKLREALDDDDTVDSVAAKLGVHRATLSRTLTGARPLSKPLAARIRLYLRQHRRRRSAP